MEKVGTFGMSVSVVLLRYVLLFGGRERCVMWMFSVRVQCPMWNVIVQCHYDVRFSMV